MNRDESMSRLWAKTDPLHPLWCHMIDTAAVCEQLLLCMGFQCELPAIWMIFLAAMHDIGKADPEFQMHHEPSRETLADFGLPFLAEKTEFRHEARSGDFMSRYLRTNHGWGKYATRVVKAAIRGHHGNFSPKSCDDKTVGYEQWKQIRTQLSDMIADVVNIADEPFSPVEFSDASKTGVILTGLTVLSDWIASNHKLFNFTNLNTDAEPDDYWQRAREKAFSAVKALQLDQTNGYPLSSTPMFRDIWPDIHDLKSSQQALENACLKGVPPGLAIIEAPMGEGKTESAVYLAEYWRSLSGCRGTYIALPTMATSNQMHERYNKFLHKYRPNMSASRLVHGMAWLLDDVSTENDPEIYGEDKEEEQLLAGDWFRPSKRALIAPEAVGTIDQALMAALNVKHGFLRLLGLSSKVLVIDEAHAYDEYMTVILERLLEWLRILRVPVIMLSATLSHRQKQKLVEAYGGKLRDCDASGEAYPLITFIVLDGEVRSVRVESQPARMIRLKKHSGLLDDVEKTAGLAVDLVRNGGCACVLVNTVKQAQAVFKSLEQQDLGGEHYLFHARFPAWRRNEIERFV